MVLGKSIYMHLMVKLVRQDMRTNVALVPGTEPEKIIKGGGNITLDK
jgi:hypothetical protein